VQPTVERVNFGGEDYKRSKGQEHNTVGLYIIDHQFIMSDSKISNETN